MIPENLLKILCCPVDKAPVEEDGSYLVCTFCKRKYLIKEEILILHKDEAITGDNEG